MEQVGVVLTQGPMDWQIVQQDEHGHGRLEIGGRWAIDVPGRVEVRLVREDTSAPVSASLDWQGAETRDDGTWSATLESIPAGGLYRLETRVSAVDAPAYEWSCRGDMRHFLGVGDLWVIAGQSNSAGYGRDAVEDPPELGVHVFRNSGKWSVAAHPLNESTDTAHPVNREGANPGHSPYLAFAKAVRRETGVPIGLVQTALGGSPLSQWNPTEPGDSVLFDNMIHCVGLVGGGVRGILWYQGESDGGPGIADTYRQRFASAVGAWREALRQPELPVLTVQLNRVLQDCAPPDDRAWSILREAQRQAAATVPHVAVVPAIDLPLSDVVHISAFGNMALGLRLARAALGMAYGRDVAYRAPETQAAQRIEDGRVVELVFRNVTSRMECNDLTSIPFRIEQDGATAPIAAVTYPGGPLVRITMAEPLVGPAVVHGAYGMNPPRVPMDVERQMPMLGFCDIPIG